MDLNVSLLNKNVYTIKILLNCLFITLARILFSPEPNQLFPCLYLLHVYAQRYETKQSIKKNGILIVIFLIYVR